VKNICKETYELIQKTREMEYKDWWDLMSENEQEGQFAVIKDNVVAVEEYDDPLVSHHVFVFSSKEKAREYFERLRKLAELHDLVVHVPADELKFLAQAVDLDVVYKACREDESEV